MNLFLGVFFGPLKDHEQHCDCGLVVVVSVKDHEQHCDCGLVVVSVKDHEQHLDCGFGGGVGERS